MKKHLWLPLAAFLFLQCSGKEIPNNSKLVVFIVIDQLPGELFQRIEDEFSGGFKWLLDHGIEFRNAHHEHGYTVTGTGHFVLGSGRYPGPAGILGNNWYDRELKKTIYCVEDSISNVIGSEGDARSYRQTQSTAIGDWIKQKDPKSKVFTVAGKDRGAVFLGGKNADLAIYYNWNGSFISSDFYADKLPGWLEDYNGNLDFSVYRDSIWDHVAEPEYYEKYGTIDHFYGEVDQFDTDPYSPTLPVSLKSKSLEEVNNYIGATPWFDKTVLELANILIKNEDLGIDGHVDYLGVGISMADWIGHNFGPHSHEVLDYYLRLDQYLMKFIGEIDSDVGLENVMFILSSDHGAIPLPEYLQSQGIDAGRMNRDIFKEKLAEIHDKTNHEITYESGGFYYPNDYNGFQKTAALEIIKNELADINAIDQLLTKENILELKGNDSFSRRMRNMIHPQKSADVIIVYKKNYCSRYPLGSTHGTPYDYDTHVPLIFSNLNIKSQKVERSVATVDIAPTIARTVGARIPDEVDGIVLSEVVK